MSQKADLLFLLLPRQSLDGALRFEPEWGTSIAPLSDTYSGTCL